MVKFEQELLDNQTKHRRWAKYALFGGVFLLVFTPFIFTRTAWFDWIVFKDTGAIGDTIGGITAPFLNLAGAVLIYLSFSQQMEANKIQFNALKDDKIEKRDLQIYNICEQLTEEIQNDILRIKHYNLKGFVGLKDILNDTIILDSEIGDDTLDHITSILLKNKLLLNRINTIKEREYKQILLQKYTIDYYQKIFRTTIINELKKDNIESGTINYHLAKLLRSIAKLHEIIEEDLLATL